MCNKAKSEFFDVISARGVAIFQARLELVRYEARAQLSNKCSTSHGSNHIHEGSAVNKSDALI